MSESQENLPKDAQERPTPQSLQVVMRGIYAAVPQRMRPLSQDPFSDEYLKSNLDQAKRRLHSEHKILLRGKLEHLLLAAQDTTTENFRTRILQEFDDLYYYGRRTDGHNMTNWFWEVLIDQKNPNGGGIFDLDSARRIEFDCFSIVETQIFNKIDENQCVENSDEDDAEMRKFLKDWQDQYKALHNKDLPQDPISL